MLDLKIRALAELERRKREYRRNINLDDWLVERSPHLTWDPAHLVYMRRNGLEQILAGKTRKIMFFLPIQHGKALAVDTPIATARGFKLIGDLKIGDKVFDENGKICTVTYKSPIWHNRKVYKISPDDKDSIIADEEHEWLTRLCCTHNKFKLKTTKYLADRACKVNPMIKIHKALRLPVKKLPIDPYVLGIWLGDGSKDGGIISKSSPDDVFIKKRIEQYGYRVSETHKTLRFTIYGLRKELVNNNLLFNKHIPESYLWASIEQRLALLQGLMDTDGYIAETGQCEFCNTNENIALGVQHLVRSLGYKASLGVGRATLYGKDCGPKYRVGFYMANAASLPRKRNKSRDSNLPHRYITIEDAGYSDTVCIGVDSPSHLFLCGKSMLTTHNSTQNSIHFPACYIEKNQNKNIVLAANTQIFANKFSRQIKRLLEGKVEFAKDRKGAAEWELKEGGSFTCGGIGIGTGLPIDLCVIDDPIKTAEQAASKTCRDAAWEWWSYSISPRIRERTSVLFTMTRWHQDDLAGRILETEGDEWTVISLAGLYDDESKPDPLGRKIGEALWPSQYSVKKLLKFKKQYPAMFESLIQQRPSAVEGEIFKREHFKYYTEAPNFKLKIMSVDTAFKTGAMNDYTVCAVFGVAENGYYLLDLWRHKATYPDVKQAVLSIYNKHNPNRVLIEDKASGQSLIQDYQRTTRMPITPIKPTGSKEDRASAATGSFEAGLIYFPAQAVWLTDLVEELCMFPNAHHDDQVDVITQFLNFMRQGRTNDIRIIAI